jgi:hypothetical protein
VDGCGYRPTAGSVPAGASGALDPWTNAAAAGSVGPIRRLPPTVLVLAALASPATAAAARPDLVVTRVAAPPAVVAPGRLVDVSATVRNRGRARAKASSLHFLLSRDARASADDRRIGQRFVRPLRRGKRGGGFASVSMPAAAGAWRLIACADGARAVRERRERNNCRTAATTINVVFPAPPPGPGPGPAPQPETCNGADDDGDGQADDGVCVVSVALAGAGSGTVTSAPAGIACPPTCSAAFPAGGAVTLTAAPAAGSVFAGWAGACAADPCKVTPGEPRVTATFAAAPPQAGDLVINEVHADVDLTLGDANGDGTRSATDDEFVEVVNVASRAVDLSGVRIHDSALLRHAFPAGASLRAGCAFVVFGGGTPTGAFGGALATVASTGALSFADVGDTVSVRDSSGAVTLDAFTYPDDPLDDSLTRSPDLGPPPFVHHGTVSADLFSPGRKLDGTAFC